MAKGKLNKGHNSVTINEIITELKFDLRIMVKNIVQKYQKFGQEKLRFEHENKTGGEGVTLNAPLPFWGDMKKYPYFNIKWFLVKIGLNYRFVTKSPKKRRKYG